VTTLAPHDQLAHGLLRIHAALRRSLETITRVSADAIPDSDRAGFADFCARFTQFLRTHHDGEEEIVFPKLVEAAGRTSRPELASSVTDWRSDHKKLLVQLSALEAAIAQLRTGGPQEPLQRAANEVRDLLHPHLAAEEKALDGSALGGLLRAEEIDKLEVASAKHGQRVGGPRVLMLLVHELSDDEQQAHFSKMPWLVRKLLIKRIWAGSFRGCLKYAHNPSIAL
jgi:hemerythrin-like domain-containing protein